MSLKNKINRILFNSGLAIAAAAAVTLGSCTDEIDLNGSNGQGDSPTYNEPSLVFDFELTPFDSESSSSSLYHPEDDHGEAWENYVDPSKIRVLFCDLEGNYLFEADQRFISVISKTSKWSGETNAYRVTIPQRDLFPADRDSLQNLEIRQALFEDGFKVAVLANWPLFVEDSREIDPETGDELLGPTDISTELDFVWDPTHTERNSKIGYLGQCIFDNVYGVMTTDPKGGATIANEPYKHLAFYDEHLHMTKGGRMGVYTSWVAYLYSTQKDVANKIRAGKDDPESGLRYTYSYSGSGDNFKYTPYSYERTVDARNVYTLENIWRLWNFSAGKSCSYHYLNDPGRVNAYWEARNENVLIAALDNIKWPNKFEIVDKVSGETLLHSDNVNASFVKYDGTSESGYITLPGVMDTTTFNKIRVSVKDNATLVTQFENSAIQFKAYGEGTLRIRAKGSNLNTRIAVLTRIPGKVNTEKVQFVTEREGGGYSKTSSDPFFDPLQRGEEFIFRQEYGQGGEYIIDPSSNTYVEVYIGVLDGEADIYEIEYMRDRHIYDSARNAIMPSITNPIPMYGIQIFDPIGNYLMPDETFNMSDDSQNNYLQPYYDSNLLPKYNYRNVYMLRSVAKVELRFKASVFANNPPEHVYMRVMNRTARCEPKDVINPTDWLWYGADGLNTFNGETTIIPSVVHDMFVGVAQEVENIKKYGPLHNANESSVTYYRNKTSWFYGFWAQSASDITDPKTHNMYFWQTPWDWGQAAGTITVPETDYPYPHIFNSRIDRSDYCRFHSVPDKDGYIRYIMYVPEKNIDDADVKGDASARPKVEHVEIRFKGMNGALNFDDSDCYRIYFTNYAENGVNMKAYERAGGGSLDFDEVEKRADNQLLNMLQPIVRNCHYIFTINSINDEKIGVNFMVCGAASRTGQRFVIN